MTTLKCPAGYIFVLAQGVRKARADCMLEEDEILYLPGQPSRCERRMSESHEKQN